MTIAEELMALRGALIAQVADTIDALESAAAVYKRGGSREEVAAADLRAESFLWALAATGHLMCGAHPLPPEALEQARAEALERGRAVNALADALPDDPTRH